MTRFSRLIGVLWLLIGGISATSTSAVAQVEAVKPWLGIAIDQGLKGVLVTEVLASTPAAAAGLAKGDEVTAVDDTRVKTPTELIKTVQAHGVGNTVTVHYIRNGVPASKAIKLVAKPDQLELLRQKLVGQPVPPFEVAVLHGDAPAKSSELKGKVVILEFWATWCPACLSTHERLSQLATQRRGDGLVVLAVSDEGEAEIKAYVAKTKPAFVVARDTKQSMQKDWLVPAIPLLAVLDRNGNVAFATLGAGTYLEEAIREAEKLLTK